MSKIKTISICLMVAVTTAISAIDASPAPIIIKLSHTAAENTPKGQMANKFKTLVAERLGDKISVEVFPNSQLFGDDKVLEALLSGEVQLAVPSLSKFAKYTKALQLYELPFLFKDMHAVEKFQQSDEGQKLLLVMENKGMTGLGYLHDGLKQLSANEKLSSPDNARGKTFHTTGSEILMEQFKVINAIPVQAPTAEVYPLLKTKTIDGQEDTWGNIRSRRYFEVQPYITESNHGVLDYMVVTSTEFWVAIPEEIRLKVKSALDEAIAYGNQVSSNEEASARQEIIDSKLTELVQLTGEQRQRWVNVMKPIWGKFSEAIDDKYIQAAIDSNKL